MKVITKYYTLLILCVAVYFYGSKLIFDKVYETSQIVIDELFHIPQGLAYCNGNFSHWDPKITTLPGLYVISALTVGTFFTCSTYTLRFVNLVGSCFNLILFSSVLKFTFGSPTESQFNIVFHALSLALLPPLYFFSHVYYTDTLSLLFLVLFSRFCVIRKSKWLVFVTGMCSVIMRQTNVVWVAMMLGHKVLIQLINSSRVFGNKHLTKMTLNKHSVIAKDIDSSKIKRHYNLYDLYIALKYHFSTCFTTAFLYTHLTDLSIICQEIAILISFIIFLMVNGSIVVGDKQAHKMTLHTPQLLYFLLFYGVFGLPYVLVKFVTTIKMMFNKRIMVLILAIIFFMMIHFNTIVHPYLLADNRHYTFYIWNRWFGKYDYAMYVMIPVYVFLFFSLYDNVKDQNCVSFLIPYSICLILVLALQKLVDVRYFLVPYVILRFRFMKPTFKIILGEFLWYLFLNVVTFHLFFTKEIIWNDFKEVQRIIW